MAKKPKSSGWSVPHIPFSLKPETARSIYAVLAILATLLFLVAPIVQAGVAGKLLYETLSGFFGVGYFLIPLSLMLFAIGLMREKETGASGTRLLGATVLFLAGISVLSIVNESGGIAGHWVGTPFVFLFDTGFAVVILGGIAIAGSLIALDTPFSLPKKLLSYLLQFLKRTPDSSMVITDPYKETGVENQTQETRKKEETLREKKPAKKAFREETAEVLEGIQFAPADTAYSPPPLSLLERDKGKPEVGDIKANANLIKRTLQNFVITVEMDEVSLGRDIAGASHFANITKMPHLLVAGATGSGKSVAIHALITSLLYRNGPASLRFIMVDPKRVELTLYNAIPHLLSPVITEPKKAILALKWAAKEMERRYDILEKNSVRDIQSYHENIVTPASENRDPESRVDQMPYIVIVADELADIMQSYPRELEAAIVRLAQMSRAVGIHLILSTQRPSVNVITGLIKANVPARIAM